MSGVSKIFLYTRFERFWHWVQALLILVLIVTGFEVHGVYRLLGFKRAVVLHNFCAWIWLSLYIFILFWMAITGEWRQYIPTFRKLLEVVHFYLIGIFRGESHPVPKTTRTKHNPLQRLAYLGVVTIIVPIQLVTGYLYYFYNRFPDLGLSWPLYPIAVLHTAGGFAMISFILAHVYMTTTGSRLSSHLKPMLTGWDEVESISGHEWESRKKRSFVAPTEGSKLDE